jgi:hypothetical protein
MLSSMVSVMRNIIQLYSSVPRNIRAWRKLTYFPLMSVVDNQNCLSMKICGINAKMSSLALKLIFIQVWHVYALCRAWGLFLDISNIIYKEIQNVPKPAPRWGQTTDLNAQG